MNRQDGYHHDISSFQVGRKREKVSTEKDQEANQHCSGRICKEGGNKDTKHNSGKKGQQPKDEQQDKVRVGVECQGCSRSGDGSKEMKDSKGQEPGPSDIRLGNGHHFHEFLLTKLLLECNGPDNRRDWVQ